MSVLVIIPCLNEADTLEPLVEQLAAQSEPLMHIVVVDGGSTDGTIDIARRLAATHLHVSLMHNPKRIQSAAVNLAVATYGDTCEWLIRIDAHAEYPDDYCAALVRDAEKMQADSVVVGMLTIGISDFQKAAATAQNSILGNGGSAHRSALKAGRWVDHGHHALMRISAFRAVGGYDEDFTHNEDAELDHRLRLAGFSIWLTADTRITYYPRANPHALFQQYRNYGKGRARMLLAHRERPKLRQLAPVAVLPAVVLALLAPFDSIMALPLLAWALLCVGYGMVLTQKARKLQEMAAAAGEVIPPQKWGSLFLTGIAAMLMHLGWSLGFWESLTQWARQKK
jgi:succinoglycan biosynthesis protein ExoA